MAKDESPALINRVAQSKLITLDLEKFYPEVAFAEFDVKDFLFQGLILREKDFREALKTHDWGQYHGKVLLLHCSADAIIPRWAYMLVTGHASETADSVFFGSHQEFLEDHYKKFIDQLDTGELKDKPVIIKGCSDKEVPAAAYVAITQKLLPLAASIMYGEPCSTVPVFKRKKK